ncbi:MAG: hypothetical protein P1U85_21180 [Verrucomicrobiales bacterium]|nr:hypothetical protein [Verrucomicrobiales bacterium]
MLNELKEVWKNGAVFWLTTEMSWNSNRGLLEDIIDEKCVFLKKGKDLKTLLQQILDTVREHYTRGMSSLIVVDDLMTEIYNGGIGKELIELMTQGRHAYASVWLLTQGLLKGGQLG